MRIKKDSKLKVKHKKTQNKTSKINMCTYRIGFQLPITGMLFLIVLLQSHNGRVIAGKEKKRKNLLILTTGSISHSISRTHDNRIKK